MKRYFRNLHEYLDLVEVTDVFKNSVSLEYAKKGFLYRIRDLGGKLIFIGNGGSAAIASHMALDWTKAGGIPSLAFNDLVALTAFSNDNGYENVFKNQLYYHMAPSDYLIAISSSGESKNIINSVEYARERNVYTVTFSGFSPLNTLRNKGHLNFYVPSHEYGFVELAHLTLLHALLDIHRGWNGK